MVTARQWLSNRKLHDEVFEELVDKIRVRDSSLTEYQHIQNMKQLRHMIWVAERDDTQELYSFVQELLCKQELDALSWRSRKGSRPMYLHKISCVRDMIWAEYLKLL